MIFLKRLIARFMHYGTCPNCGHTVSYSTDNGTTSCPGCHKRLEIHNGEITGWR